MDSNFLGLPYCIAWGAFAEHCVFEWSLTFAGVWSACCVSRMFSSCALSMFEFGSFASSSIVNGWAG